MVHFEGYLALTQLLQLFMTDRVQR